MAIHSQMKMKYQKTFNNYFASIAEKTKVSINYSPKHFSDFLKDKNQTLFFKALPIITKYTMQYLPWIQISQLDQIAYLQGY